LLICLGILFTGCGHGASNPDAGADADAYTDTDTDTDADTDTMGDDGGDVTDTGDLPAGDDAINHPPVAQTESYQVNEDEVLTVDAPNGVLANDTDPDGDQLFAAERTSPLHGGLVLNQDGSFVYTPHANYYGPDRFIYVAGDTRAISDQTQVDIEVLPVNDPPVAYPDGYHTEPGVLLDLGPIGNVLNNDDDPDNEPLTAVLITDVSNGTLTLNPAGSFTYVPDPGFEGRDSFVYEAQDAALLSSSAEVSLWVLPRLQMDWVVSAGGPSYEMAEAVAAFSDGSSVITGTFDSTCTFGLGEPNETTLDAGTASNFFIARYNNDGTLAWAKSAPSDGMDDTGFAVVALSDDSCIAVGQFMRDAVFGAGEPNETTLSANGRGIFLARYNADGTLAWAKSAGSGSSWEKANGIVELSDGSFGVVGRFGGDAVFGAGEPNETTLETVGSADIFIARYNPDGTLVWARGAGGGSHEDEGAAICALSDDSMAITGSFGSVAVFGAGEPNETTLDEAGDSGDVFVARYDSDGSLLWAQRGGSASLWDHGMGLAPLPDDSFIATGWHGPSSSFDGVTLGSDGRNDVFIIRYTKDGEILWAHRAGGNEFGDEGRAVTVLSDGTIVVTGSFRETATYGEDTPNETTFTASGEHDIFLARYAPDGTFIGAHHSGGIGWDTSHGLSPLQNGAVLLTGRFAETCTFGAGEPSETDLTATDSNDVFLMRYSP
jgi:uncharacterized delta-60 repeat protein